MTNSSQPRPNHFKWSSSHVAKASSGNTESWRNPLNPWPEWAKQQIQREMAGSQIPQLPSAQTIASLCEKRKKELAKQKAHQERMERRQHSKVDQENMGNSAQNSMPRNNVSLATKTKGLGVRKPSDSTPKKLVLRRASAPMISVPSNDSAPLSVLQERSVDEKSKPNSALKPRRFSMSTKQKRLVNRSQSDATAGTQPKVVRIWFGGKQSHLSHMFSKSTK